MRWKELESSQFVIAMFVQCTSSVTRASRLRLIARLPASVQTSRVLTRLTICPAGGNTTAEWS
jgi:hypothetical protein